MNQPDTAPAPEQPGCPSTRAETTSLSLSGDELVDGAGRPVAPLVSRSWAGLPSWSTNHMRAAPGSDPQGWAPRPH